jgi:hypothetical protein
VWSPKKWTGDWTFSRLFSEKQARASACRTRPVNFEEAFDESGAGCNCGDLDPRAGRWRHDWRLVHLKPQSDGDADPQQKIAANGQLDGALGRLLAVAENYPQLKSNENFLQLQDELAGTENRIAVERKRYNDSIQAYNTYIGQFPNSIFAAWGGFQRNNDYFAASAASQEVPKVQFPGATP